LRRRADHRDRTRAQQGCRSCMLSPLMTRDTCRDAFSLAGRSGPAYRRPSVHASHVFY
jgi:hypothetical protein